MNKRLKFIKWLFAMLAAYFILPLSYSYAQECEPCKVKHYVNAILETYPKSHLKDIYKSCFQDVFGPEHLVTNKMEVMKYIDMELGMKYRTANPLYEYCGLDSNFVRVNLILVKNGTIDEELLADLFMDSSKQGMKMDMWKKKWQDILSVIRDMGVEFEDFDKDDNFIEELIDSGGYACSHSDAFKNEYLPHYRIIKRELFDKELLPKIKNFAE